MENLLYGLSSAIDVQHVKPAYAYPHSGCGSKKDHDLRYGYTGVAMIEAIEHQLQVEKENLGDPNIQVVLVSAASLSALRKGYPSYYLDSTRFVDALRKATAT